MQDKPNVSYKSYITTAIVALSMTVYILWDKQILQQTDKAEIYKILCDGFFVPGIILASLGVLMIISNQGFFNIFNYSMRMLFDNFTKKKNFRHEYNTYFDYVQSRYDKKVSVSFILHVGLVFVVIAIIFNFLFYGVYVEV